MSHNSKKAVRLIRSVHAARESLNMRLFLAIPLSNDVKKILLSYQPPSGDYIKIVGDNQLHLTLHFLGNANLFEIAPVISDIRFEEFNLTLDGVGCFEGNRNRIMWAGVSPNEALIQLHSDIGKRLQKAGVTLDSRSYSPHITLARCQHKYSEEKIQNFLKTKIDDLKFRVDHFLLYSSVFVNDEPLYKILRKYILKSVEN